MPIYLKKGYLKIGLPLNPAEYEVTKEANNSTVSIYRLGEISMMGKAKLKTLSFSSIFPNLRNEYSFLQPVDLLFPDEYVDTILRWEDEGPVNVVWTDAEISMTMTIENFSYSEKDGTGDVYYSISFKQWRRPAFKKPAPQTNVIGTIKPPTTSRPTKPVKTVKYTVKKGDNLQKIAFKYTGSKNNWKTIYTQNKKVIEAAARKHGQNSSRGGNLIYAGTKLVIKVKK